jgi:DNA polymerase V
MGKVYIAIDLKSFYASVECVERGLDPLTAKLVVADETRTDKTICLAVSPALKALGIPGRARLYEVKQKAKDFIIAMPRMAYYISYSTRIYNIYLRYIAEEDMHVYSIDEVFIDATNYLDTYKMNGHELAIRMIQDVLTVTNITATAGIGTNLYLAKVAMDIVAKHMPADKDGVRVAEVDERSYRELLWAHEPLTDFWRVGRGIQRRLAKYDLYTMGDIARFSLNHSERLYQEFGVNAELLIDHAWGYEPCTMRDIKAFRPSKNSHGSGQVLTEPYSFEKARIVVREMAEELALDLVEKGLVTNSVSLFVSYDTASDLTGYEGAVGTDWYGRTAAKPSGGTAKLKRYTDSSRLICEAVMAIYDSTVHVGLLIRRLGVNANGVIPRDRKLNKLEYIQTDLFSDTEEILRREEKEKEELERESRRQEAVLKIKQRFGKNAVLLGTSLEDGATGKLRNEQIGGHRK